MTQAQVAAELGVSRALVQVIESKALRKLRVTLEAMGIDGPGAEAINWWGEGESDG